MKKLIRGILYLSLLLSTFHVKAQIDDVLDRLTVYSLAYPQEKVFLHTDRATYGDGETIWFQAYVTLSPLGVFTDLSNTLYVQLVNESGELVLQDKVFVENGSGPGHLEIPANLAQGKYQLIAFTNWMRNFGDYTYYRKDIKVLTQALASVEAPSRSEGLDLQFLPESGSLIANVPTTIAFKAVNSNGMPKAVKGNIYDENGQVVASFESMHDGMGTFFMSPVANTNYYAIVDGTEDRIEFPQVKTKGAHLKINYLEDQVKVSIIQQGFENTDGNFHLLIHNKGFLSSALQVEAKRSLSIANLAFEKLDRGVNSLTLLGPNMEPLAERLIFVEKTNNPIQADVLTDQIGTRERAAINIQLDLPDTVSAVLSLSAVDISQTPEESNKKNIISELLLSSELSGQIYNPSFYFEQSKEVRQQLIDLLMLIHGWRSFDFQAVADGQFPEITHVPEKGVTISGRAFKKGKKEKVAKNADLVLIRQHDELPVFLDTKTDKDGYFTFSEAIIAENDSLIIRGTREKNGRSDLRIEFDTIVQTFPTKYIQQLQKSISAATEKEEKFVQLKEERKQIDEAYGFLLDSTAIQLDDVVVEGYKTQERPDSVLLATSIGRGDDVEDFQDPMYSGSYTTVFNALIGKLPGVQISPSGGVSIRQAGRISGSEPLFLLNDVPVDKSLIEQLTVQQLDRVVVFKSLAKTAIYGQQGAGGIMAFYTKEGAQTGIKQKDRSKISIAQFLNGYQAEKVFYTPKYDEPRAEHIIPDRRVLVHWEPMIVLTGKELRTIEFWSSDLAGTIAIEIQGLTSEGDPIYTKKEIEVSAEN